MGVAAALVLIGKAVGPAIASSLVAKASEAAFGEFLKAFPKGKALSDTEILKRSFDSITLKEELEKVILTDYEAPNLNTLYSAFQEAGYTDDMLPGFDFKAAMNAFIGKFREELSDVIEHRRNEERGRLNVYLRQVEEQCGWLDFVGIPDLKDKEDLRLEEIFITLRARQQVPEGDILPEEESEDGVVGKTLVARWDIRESARMEKSPHPPFQRGSKGAAPQRGELMRDAAPVELNDAMKDSKRLVILGGPGAGKTTMLRYAALMVAQGNAKSELGLSDGLVPVFVELSRFAARDDEQQSLLDFIYDYLRFRLSISPPPNFFETYLEQRKCVVLLDGLDEVATLGQRVEVKNVVTAFASRYGGNTFVVTSRIAGYNEASLGRDFTHFTVCDFTDEDVKQFAQKWYEAREGKTQDALTNAEDLVKVIRDTPRVAALARNPLMLTIIALVHRVEAELPNQRVKLYDKCTESLLYTWDAVKRLGGKSMSEEDKRKRLGWIAYWMQNMPGSGERERTVKRGPLQYRLAELLVENGEAADMSAGESQAKLFLDQIRSRTGVLIERGRDMYSFVHLTFQEYFAACEVHRRLLDAAMTVGIDEFWEEELKSRLHDPRWQEVIPLFLGKLSMGSDRAASEMVKRTLNAGSKHEDILHRDLLLAGRCLGDDVVVDNLLKECILDGIFDLLRRGKHPTLRSRAIEILAAMRGSRYEDEIVRWLIQALSHEDFIFRISATEVLSRLGAKSEDAVHAFIEALGNGDDLTRSTAAGFLANLGAAPIDVIGALIKALGDYNSRVRSRAAYALGNLVRGSEDVIDALIKALGDDDSDVRSSAAYALSDLGAASKGAVDALIETLQDEDDLVRTAVAHALSRLGAACECAEDALEARGNLSTASKDIVGTLIEALGADDSGVRYSSTYALGKLGVASPDVIDALIEALKDEENGVQYGAVCALGKLGMASDNVINAFIEALSGRGRNVRSVAAEALGNLGTASADVTHALIKALGDEDEYYGVRIRAAEALGKLGIASKDSMDALIKALGDEEWTVRSSAAVALGNLGTASADVIDALIKAMGSEDSAVRSRAADALGKLGGGSAEVMNALLERLDSERYSDAADAMFEAISSLAAAEAEGQTQDARRKTQDIRLMLRHVGDIRLRILCRGGFATRPRAGHRPAPTPNMDALEDSIELVG